MSARIIAFDTETTGLDPAKDEIIAIAMVTLDEHFNEVGRKAIFAQPDVKVSEEAAKINGYVYEEWEARGAVSQVMLFAEVHEFIRSQKAKKPLIPMGHNVGFDINFLKALFKKNEAKDYGRLMSYHSMDTIGITMFCDLAKFDKLNSAYKLTELCERFGITLDNAHDATADIDATIELFRTLYKGMGGDTSELPEPVRVNNMLKKVAGVWKVNGGKHKGRSVESVATEAPDYLEWMLNKFDDLSPEQKECLEVAIGN